jgi:nicotinate-nucleotide--dimethylbenzimidazole phosphoribosyltransferase
VTDALTRLLGDLTAPDAGAAAAVRARAARTLRPTGALARLDEVAAWLAAWQGTDRPTVSNPVAAVFVADHGVAVEGVSAYPPAVTASMLEALRAEVATANVLARGTGVRLVVSDVGVGRPTGNLRREAALDRARFDRSVRSGIDLVRAEPADLLVLGEMGIGNTTAAAAVCAALFGGPAEDWTGRGTGIDDEAYRRKVDVVGDAAARVDGLPPVEVLRQVGGAELVAIAGAVAEARARRIPVVLDGFVVTAAAATLEAARPGVLAHCLAGHRSGEPGHALLLEKLGLEPLLDLGLRLGEASGALLVVPLVRLACAAVTDVATFEEWGLEA